MVATAEEEIVLHVHVPYAGLSGVLGPSITYSGRRAQPQQLWRNLLRKVSNPLLPLLLPPPLPPSLFFFISSINESPSAIDYLVMEFSTNWRHLSLVNSTEGDGW